jgi:hypothetical protein
MVFNYKTGLFKVLLVLTQLVLDSGYRLGGAVMGRSHRCSDSCRTLKRAGDTRRNNVSDLL